MDIARARLMQERRSLQSNRPPGCWAKPCKGADGAVELTKWEFGILPAKTSAFSMPDDLVLTGTMTFPPEYPAKPPVVQFVPELFHTNVHPSGVVCLSLLLEHGHHPGAGHVGFWQAGLSIADILRALITFLDEPNPNSIANKDACSLLSTSGAAAYNERVRLFVREYAARKEAAAKRG